MPNQTILRLPEVMKRTGLSRSTIYLLIKTRQIKAPIQLSARAVGWVENEINDFIESRIAVSRGTNKRDAT